MLLRKNRKFYKNPFLLFFSKILIAFLIIILFSYLVLIVLFAFFSRDLPAPGKVASNKKSSTIFLDRDNKVIYELYKDKNRVPVSLEIIPDYLKKATIAIEDKDFYKHSGFSIRGIIRAMLNIIFRSQLQGGSTLTQQLIKNTLLSSERTLTRKIKEFILANELERRYTKDQILEMYLNDAPYGGTFWGVESAAKGYFNKSVKDLNLIESAFLAGLPQRPSYYSPFVGKSDSYIQRTKDVLRRMREDGYITKNQEKEALNNLKKIKFADQSGSFNAPHFVFFVRDQIISLLGEKALDSGLKIKTTLSLDIQKEAEKIIKDEIKKLKGLNVSNGAIVVINPNTGEILSMVGSVDYNDKKFGKYNTAVALRQPGSAVKPITYALAFEKGYTPATVLMDLKTFFPSQGGKDYIPENYDGNYRGPIQLRFALGNSINIPSVKLLAMIGIRDFLQKAYEMGLENFEPTEKNLKRFGLSITLGGGETKLLDLTSAFSVFASSGIKRPPYSILEIKDYQNKTIYKHKKISEKKVISPAVSFLISHILSDNNARLLVFGPQSYLNIPGKTVAVKTGTTDDKRDNWTIGYTKEIVVGVWVGNNDNSPMNPRIASGVTGATPIWHRLMVNLLKKYRDGIPEKPENITALEIDAYLGGLPKDGYPKRSEYFIKGTEPKEISSYYKKLKISKNNGKLANELEIRTGEFEEKEFILINENDPISTDGVNRWQQAIDEWLKNQSDEKFKAPTEISEIKKDDLVIQIKEPSDKSTINNNKINLKAKIISLESIKKLEIFVNNSVILSYQEDKKDIEEPIELSDGVYEIKIKAENTKGKISESMIKIGINKPWNYLSPTPTNINIFSPTPTETSSL